MAYVDENLNDPTKMFNTVLYTGNGSTQSITGVGFRPDWVWLKARNHAYSHQLFDAVRGATKLLSSEEASAEQTLSGVTSFDSDGFAVGSDAGSNGNAKTFASWNWLAGGTAPAITYTVKVVSDSGNKYRFDDFGTSAVTLDLQEGGTYTFDQSDSSNSGHPLRFSTTSDGTHGGGSEFTTNVTTTGTPGSAGAKTVITVASGTATLYYYCSVHSGMGGQANTNSTFGSSNFAGSIQSTVSANTTAGFSIVSYTGNGTAGATIGHGLNSLPKWIIIKNRSSGSTNWQTYHHSLDDGAGTHEIFLDLTSAKNASSGSMNNTAPTSTVVTKGTGSYGNGNGENYIMYIFSEKKGYSKFGSYTGNGSTDGTFIYTGFKPAWVMVKSASATESWYTYDTKRNTFNPLDKGITNNQNITEFTFAPWDFTSNGLKARQNWSGNNTSGVTYIYMAFAESPFVNSNGVPTNAR